MQCFRKLTLELEKICMCMDVGGYVLCVEAQMTTEV